MLIASLQDVTKRYDERRRIVGKLRLENTLVIVTDTNRRSGTTPLG